jgi:hypothetical protein
MRARFAVARTAVGRLLCAPGDQASQASGTVQPVGARFQTGCVCQFRHRRRRVGGELVAPLPPKSAHATTWDGSGNRNLVPPGYVVPRAADISALIEARLLARSLHLDPTTQQRPSGRGQ